MIESNWLISFDFFFENEERRKKIHLIWASNQKKNIDRNEKQSMSRDKKKKKKLDLIWANEREREVNTFSSSNDWKLDFHSRLTIVLLIEKLECAFIFLFKSLIRADRMSRSYGEGERESAKIHRSYWITDETSERIWLKRSVYSNCSSGFVSIPKVLTRINAWVLV